MKPLLLLALTAAAAWGQGTAPLRARELFYTPPPDASAVKAPAAPVPAAPAPAPAPKAVAKKNPTKTSTPAQPVVPTPTEAVVDKPATGPLGMRYSVLKRNAAGEYQEVDVDTVFHSGDRIRLEAQANSTGYLYVVAQGSSGNWQVLFPSREVSNGSNQVHRGETRLVPGGNQGQFVFDEQAGTEKLFFVLSRQPEQSLDKLIYSMGGQSAPADPTVVTPAAPNRVLMAQASISDDVIARIRGEMQARDLIFEKVDNEKVVSQNGTPAGAPVKIETAAYVVNRSSAADARLVVDLKLKHQ
ncbi:MAG: DUF4384 domain-containing protein [Acidobacteriota bacterium]|nr:DUF4384 domain-containing protein [Acidobacteriota bacterium]